MLYQANHGVSQSEEEMMLESSSSSAAASSSSSSSLSLSSSASGMDLDNTMDVDPVLLKLIVTTTTLNNISWGCTPTILDLSESDAVKKCPLREVDLQTLTDKLWPLMPVHLCADQNRIMCVN